MYKSVFFPLDPPDRPIGCLSKPRCRIQAVTRTNNTRARPQPAAPPRRFNSQDVIFLFLSRALSLSLPPLSLSSFSFLIPLSSTPSSPFPLSAMSQLFLKGWMALSPSYFRRFPPSSQKMSRQKYSNSIALLTSHDYSLLTETK